MFVTDFPIVFSIQNYYLLIYLHTILLLEMIATINAIFLYIFFHALDISSHIFFL